MRLSLFSRLSIGYLTIFLIVAAAGTSAIFQLDKFSESTQSIAEVDARILVYEKKLRDLLLTWSRPVQNFINTKDETYFSQFVQQQIEFEANIAEALALGNPAATPILRQIQSDILAYAELVKDEAQWVRANKRYTQAEYKQNRDRVVDGMLDALDKLLSSQEQLTSAKVRELAVAAKQARERSVFIVLACLVAIIAMSFWITKSITRPIGLLKGRTREIARGNFQGRVKVSSPPEIGELAAAIDSMSARLQELDRLKADFFASMSHELRTPLTSIKEGTGLLLEGAGGAITDKQHKLLTILAEESNRLISVVNSSLDLSKMEAGMMSYEFDYGNVGALIDRAVAEMTPLIEAKQINLENRVEGPLPMVRIDSERMLQVLRNLLGNAIKFSPKGGRVSVSAKPANGILEISVRDSGPGIPAENLISIFEKFSQVNHKGMMNRQGTGLGLAIAKSIVSSHGGKIWAESQPGNGSTFIFALPC